MASEYKLELRGVSKSFPGVKALDNVQLAVRPGTVHALMGENGAGKSTLMKCLFGIYKMDAGEIYIDGEKVVIENPDEVFYTKGYDIKYDKVKKKKVKVERYSLEYYKKFEGDITVRVRVDDGRELKVKTVFPVGEQKVQNKIYKEKYNKYVLTEEELNKRHDEKVKI